MCVPVKTAETIFLRPDALPDTNRAINNLNVVRSGDTCVFYSLAQGPVTHG